MNPSIIAAVSALVFASGQAIKGWLKRTPKWLPAILILWGALAGYAFERTAAGALDGLAGALAAMGLYSGSKHSIYEKEEDQKAGEVCQAPEGDQ
jgi:hypothetical protein